MAKVFEEENLCAEPIYAIDWAANNEFIALGSMDRTCKLLYTQVADEGISISGDLLLEEHDGTVRTVCSTVEEVPKLVSGGQDSYLKVWDTTTGNLISNIKGNHTHVQLPGLIIRCTASRQCWTAIRYMELARTSSSSSST